MRFSTVFLAVSSLLFAAAPGSVAATPVDGSLSKRQSFTDERFTYYEVGLGACGQTNTDDQYVVALNSQQYGSGGYCFDTITISYNGRSTQATIVDECPGCPYGGLDLSPSLFSYFADESVGVIYGDWSFN